MVPSIRRRVNEKFSEEKNREYFKEMDAAHPGQLDFRVAETPVFCDKAFKEKILSACEHIVDIIVSPTFKEESARAIPPGLNVPGENTNTQFIAFDFGICENEQGDLEPQLIE